MRNKILERVKRLKLVLTKMMLNKEDNIFFDIYYQELCQELDNLGEDYDK